ncbi:unnamed protein product [Ectocarpus sp. 12 AP-2014]
MRSMLTAAWQPAAPVLHKSISIVTGQLSLRCQWRRQETSSSSHRDSRWSLYSSLALDSSSSSGHQPPAAPGSGCREPNQSVITVSLNSRRRNSGALSAMTAEDSNTADSNKNMKQDLAALLDVLQLKEPDVLPELSKKSRALLGFGGEEALQDSDTARVVGDTVQRSGTDGYGRRSSAPWVMLDRKGVGMKADEVAAVVRSYPLLLTVGAGQARSVVNWLTRRAGLSSKQLVRVLKTHPGILRYDVETRLEPHAVWLEEEGLTNAGVAKVISKLPQMLGLNIESNLAPKTTWLKEYLGFSKVGVSSVLKAFPAVLALNVENLEGKAAWLEQRLDVDRAAVSKVLKLNPSLFGSSIENSLRPKLEWLGEGLGLEEADIAVVVRACPNVLSYSVEDNLEPKMQWLQERMHLDKEGVAAMVRTFPSILGLSPEKNIEPKLTWLRENLGLSEELVLILVKTCPQLFGCSAKANLGPTLDFFRKRLGGSREEIRELVLSNPTLLRYSLKKRMMPRAMVIEKSGLGRLVFREHVKPIAAYTDPAFEAWLDSLVLVRGMPPRSQAKAGATAGGDGGVPTEDGDL